MTRRYRQADLRGEQGSAGSEEIFGGAELKGDDESERGEDSQQHVLKLGQEAAADDTELSAGPVHVLRGGEAQGQAAAADSLSGLIGAGDRTHDRRR